MKNNKGITLIALVITIIVMLILVGVTINISTNKGGIFDSAKNAANKTTVEAEKEELIESIYDVNNDIYNARNGVNLENLGKKLTGTGKWEKDDDSNDSTLTVKNIKSGNKYSITSTGVVNEYSPSTNEKYVTFNSEMNSQKYAKIIVNQNPKFVENSANIDRQKNSKDEFIEEGFEILDENEERIYCLKVQEDETFEYTLYFSDSEGDNAWIYYPKTVGDKAMGWYYDGMDGEESITNHPLPEVTNSYVGTQDPTWTQAMFSDLLIIKE